MADKVINAYRGYAASTIKSRASVPNQADMAVVGTTVECNNITTVKIGTAIGSSSRAVGALCANALVNLWSGFAPVVRSVSSGYLVNALDSSPYNEGGDFAGYNHAAVTPGYADSNHLADTWVNINGNATFYASVVIGEPKYIDGEVSGIADVVGVALTIWDGSTLVGYDIFDLDSEGSGDEIDLSGSVNSVAANKQYTFKVYFVNSLSVFTISNALFQISQIANYSAWVKVKSVTGYIIAADDWEIDYDGVVGNDDINFNKTLGTVTFDASNTSSFDGITIQADLYDQVNDSHEITYLHGTESTPEAYTADDIIEIDAVDIYSGTLPIPNTGFILTISVEETEE